ncbi:MAG TPA: hypothetical protein VGA36_00840 [Nitriliruptorales bacterium]
MTALRPDLGDDTDDGGPDRGATIGTSPWQKVVGSIGLVVVLWVGSETYDTVTGDFGGGGGDHGPGQNAPVENQDPETDTDGGGHQPPAGGHG